MTYPVTSSRKQCFLVDEVEVADRPIPVDAACDVIDDLVHGHVSAYQVSSPTLIRTQLNPFLAAIHYAYAQHRPLTLSPDHIWLAICQGVTQHFSLQSKFEQPVQLERTPEKHVAESWYEAIKANSDQIRGRLPIGVDVNLAPSFSTTTSAEELAFLGTVGETIHPCFTYAMTLCGIPSISLEGMPEDWAAIVRQVDEFAGHGLQWWIEKLKPILREFEAASTGNVKRKFWQNMYKLEHHSGGPYITGWILKFFPYLRQEIPTSATRRNPYIERDPQPNIAKQGLTTRTIPSGITRLPMMVRGGSQQRKLSMISGFVGISQDTVSLSLRPEIGWIVRDESAAYKEQLGKRLNQRLEKGLTATIHLNTGKRYHCIQCYDGIHYIAENPLWRANCHPENAQLRSAINFDYWRQFEYDGWLFRYCPDSIDESELPALLEAFANRSKERRQRKLLWGIG